MKNQNKTRILAALMAAAMMTPFTTAVFAEDEPALIADTGVDVSVAEATHVQADGIISEINTAEEAPYILIGEDRATRTQFHISEETVFIKADGTPLALTDLKTEDTIRVYHSPAMTRSLPPQTTALVVILIEDETTIPPLYAVASAVAETEEGIEIESADGSFIFRPAAEAEVVPYKTRNIVTLADITEGSRFLAWGEVIGLSLPGVMNPHKLMLLPEGTELPPAEEAPDAAPSEGIYVNGELLDAEIKTDGEAVLLPVRAISEKLGYTVIWNGEERSVAIGDLKIALGSTEVSAAAAARSSAPQLETAPILLNELTYVPASFFELLTGNPASVSEALVEIQG